MRGFFLKLRNENQDGGILVVTLIVMSLLMLFGVSLVTVLSGLYRQASSIEFSMKAFYLAQAGIEQAITESLVKDDNKDWSDNQYQQIFKKIRFGNGQFSVKSKKGQTNLIILSATGECGAVRKTVDVLINVNWKKEPPLVNVLKWHEQKMDSLSIVF